jgi:CheY-like chemotaxis protein
MDMMSEPRFDAIVSDYQMPETDGLRFLKMVREKDEHIPFILFTGHSREDIVIEACNNGVSGYLQKGGHSAPMFVELEHKIKQAFDKSSAEESLRVKNIQANLAVGLAKLAAWELDMETKTFRFDDTFFRLVGANSRAGCVSVVSPEDYISRFIHPDDRETVVKWMRQGPGKFNSEGWGQIEHRIVAENGEVKRVAVRVKALYSPDGRLLKICGVSLDISDRRRANDELVDYTGSGEINS